MYNLEYFFICILYIFPLESKSRKANLFILIDAVPWVLIDAENLLVQPLVACCQQMHSCSGIEGGQ